MGTVMQGVALALSMAISSPEAQTSSPAPPADARALFTFREVMVPMRDGVTLQTVIMTPTGAKEPLPILLQRTPYGVPDKAYTQMPNSLSALAADGYILVFQNIRGRFKSGGTFSLAEDSKVTPGKGTIETRDGWDTVDWLVKNVPNNNRRVGIYGISYPGYTAAATLLDPHPALKAVSEQASPVDQWMNDDDHHYGALRLQYAFEYAYTVESDKAILPDYKYGTWDLYDWYLKLGPLSSVNDRYLHGTIPFWNQIVEHPNYDAFWKSQAWLGELHKTTVPTLNVAGFWDQEDPWGPWQIYRREAAHDPRQDDLMVSGPWFHGAWSRESISKLGPMPLGEDTSQTFRREIEAPFFAYWLHDQGPKPTYAAKVFETGSNVWRTYKAWPPASKSTALYLHADGTLSFTAPTAAESGAHRDYVSDPANPVPFQQRPIAATYPGADWHRWEFADQRFVDHRPDVLTFVSAPLTSDMTIAGEVAAEVFASTTGTDSDLVVKLIDVFPEDAEAPPWSEDQGPAPGEYAHSQNGYQLPIAMEVRRGRYLSSFEHPTPLVPDKPVRWDVPLRDRDHVFRAGHRIMVQIQSSWFPLIDRNPQTFTPSVYSARSSDFVKATQRVYASPDRPSQVILPIMQK